MYASASAGLSVRKHGDDFFGSRDSREHPEDAAQCLAMTIFGKGHAAIARNNHIVSAINSIARSTFDDTIGCDSGEHQMGDALRRENRFELARVEGAGNAVIPDIGE